MDEKDLVKIEKIGNKLETLEQKIEEEKELEAQKQELSEAIADESIFAHFASEYNMLDREINELDNLYSELKDHYDAMLNNRARGTLNFIQGQTSNLISLKTTKLAMIREQTNIKRNVIDYGTKKKLMEKDNSSSVGVAMEIMRQLIKSEADMDKPEIIDIECEELGDSMDIVVKELEDKGAITYSESEMNPKAVLNVEKTIRQIIASDPNELAGDSSDKKEERKNGNLNPIEYMQYNMKDAYDEYQNVLDQYEDDDESDLNFDDTGEIDEYDFDIAVGVSTDRQKWKFIAVSKDGEFLEDDFILAQLPDSDCVDMKVMRINGEVQALISDGTNYPIYTIEFDEE